MDTDKDVLTFDELMIKYFGSRWPDYQEEYIEKTVSWYLLNGLSLEKCFQLAQALRIERDDLYFDDLPGAFADALNDTSL